ncbi:hypothetical protein Syun_027919 [Stephania yunnanensis]|uniref:Uncharacterized protein n=1 Tax=Stephania yunnanensis TaxID=152371 RepID=A0AAP0ENQ9_9MAGN
MEAAAGSSRYDFDQAASFLAQNAVDWAPLVSEEDREVMDVFSVEDVERIRGFPKLGLPSAEAVHSTMEGFPSHITGTSVLPDAQDGYGLMISELLGTNISNCSTVLAEIAGLHTNISLHNETGILGDDDPIYLSLGEIPIKLNVSMPMNVVLTSAHQSSPVLCAGMSRLQELALSLALKCLSFDFVGTSLDESSEEFGTVCLEASSGGYFKPVNLFRLLCNCKTALYLLDIMYQQMSQQLAKRLYNEKVAELIGFQRCMHSCLEYLEAVPWVGDEHPKGVVGGGAGDRAGSFKDPESTQNEPRLKDPETTLNKPQGIGILKDPESTQNELRGIGSKYVKVEEYRVRLHN